MKIAIVEKQPSYIKYDKYFPFSFDQYQLVSKKMSKILKKDIELDFSILEEYDYVITVGAEPSKFIAGIGSVVTHAGHLVDNKYIPIFSPAMVSFKPEIRGAFNKAVDRLTNIISGTIHEETGEYYGIQNSGQAVAYLNKLLSEDSIKYVAMDTETTALYPRDGYVLGISISHREGFGVYIDSDCIDEEVESLLQELCNRKTIVFHNAKFDIKMLEFHFGLSFNKWEDTMVLHYMLNENEEHGLKYLAMQYTTMGDYDEPLDTYKRSYCKQHKIKLADFTYDLIPFDILFDYAAKDTDATIRLFNIFWPKINEHTNDLLKAYNNLMKPGVRFLADVETNGVPFSRDKLLKAQIDLEHEIYELEKSLYNYKEVHTVEKSLGVVFNPNSTVHVANLLFNTLGLPIQGKTATGNPTTDAAALDVLADMHELPALIKKIKQAKKIKATYIDKVLSNLDNDGRLRTNFNLTITTSGRLSSSGKLNMQQLPRDNKIVKDCIMMDDPDWVVVSQDLATAEMYYAAVLSGDTALQEIFKTGKDFHSSIAHMVFRLDCAIEEVKDLYGHLRQQAKAVSFGILYGAGAKTVSEQAPCSMADAVRAIDSYFRAFPRLKRWLEGTQQIIKNKGFIYSKLGRKRRVPNVMSSDNETAASAVRSALNFTIQSVASDINLLAGIDMNEYIKQTGLRAQIFGLVHDSILAVVHKDDLQEYGDKLAYFTQLDRGLSIAGAPVGVDLEVGETYAFKEVA
jgi:DNA polymerase I-like protein with 3'-5' exonuclease and polymerase domains